MQHQSKDNKDPIGKLLQDKRPSYLDKRIRISEDFTFYGITKTKAGEAENALALKVIKASGEQYIIQYHEFISPMYYDGATILKLSTPYLTITIEGRNLGDIVDYLAEHRLMWIKEPDTDFVEVGEGEVEVRQVGIEIK